MDSDGTAEIRRLLTETHTWAVVGLSTNTFRPAYGVARFLQGIGKRIVPVHPRAETVHGEVGYPTLADIPFDVDVVDVFVNSRRAGEIADEALQTEARGVWFQLGVIDEAAAERVRGRRSHDGHGPLPGDRVAAPGALTARPERRDCRVTVDGVNIEVTPLPGIGVRKDFALRDGRRIGVVAHRDGELELIVSKADDPDATLAEIPLDRRGRRAGQSARRAAAGRAARRGAPGPARHQHPAAADRRGSPFDGRTLGETAMRTRTGVSVVAVMRAGQVHPVAAPGLQPHRGRPRWSPSARRRGSTTRPRSSSTADAG